MRKALTFIACGLIGAILILGYQAVAVGDIEVAKRAIKEFRPGNEESGNFPHIGPLNYWTLHIDSFTQDTKVSTVAELYKSACSRLTDIYGSEAHAYSWHDEFGYDRFALVVVRYALKTPYSHLLVTAYENNDNHSFSFEHVKGEFDTKGKKLETSWALPASFRAVEGVR